MKKYFIILLLIFTFLMVGCKKKYTLKYEKIDAPHLLTDDTISSYLAISTKKDDGKMYYSVTIFANFLQGTSRYYHYYQIDYLTSKDIIEQYYHVFTSDRDERKYSQNFLPYYQIDSLKEIDVLFEYECVINEEEITDTIKYHEEMLSINNNDLSIFTSELDDLEIQYQISNNENGKYYNINIDFKDLSSGHIDMQSWILGEDNKLYPLYGIYHYELQNGNYESLGYNEFTYETSNKEIYFQINHYYDNNVKTYYYKIQM